MTLEKLISLYLEGTFALMDVYTITVPPGSVSIDTETNHGSCGFVIPVSGVASYTVDGHEYILRKGCILHAGDGMSLHKKVVSSQNWKYVLLHYTCSNPDSELPYVHFCLDVSEEASLELLEIVRKIQQDCSSDMDIQNLRRKGLLYEFIAVVLRLAEERQQAVARQTVQPALRMLNENYAVNITARELAESCCMNEREFYRAFRQETNVTPKQYQINRRMEEACRFLEAGASVSEASLRVGYHDPLYFSRLFRSHFGVPPQEFRSLDAEKSI